MEASDSLKELTIHDIKRALADRGRSQKEQILEYAVSDNNIIDFIKDQIEIKNKPR